MSKRQGSEHFKTSNINTDEYIIAAKVMRNDGMKPKEIFHTLNAWDDMLSLIKIRTIIVGQSFTAKGRRRKDIDLQHLINNRMNLLINELKS